MAGRVDRGFTGGGEEAFSDRQRIFLLERDLDESDRQLGEFRKEVKVEMASMRKLVTTRLNYVVGLGFSLLVAVIAVLVTVVASK
jgi:hypothetical protein